MSNDIAKMNDKQLRNEVQLLRDELAIMKRKYEDIIYNLDTDNFSSRFVKEQGDMRTAIKVTAEGIKSQVSKDDLENSLSQYTTLEQTANAIKTQAYASADLSKATEVNNLTEAIDTTKTYYIKDSDNNKTYYYYNDISNDWEEIINGGIGTVFEQTAEGFKMKGNVEIDGDTVVTKNLKLSGNVTWDMSNSPVQTQYSSNQSSWHTSMQNGDKYMRMSFDGGKTWSTPTKVVGDDGKNGADGDSADVDAVTIFNILTNNGGTQGLFSAFDTNTAKTKLYINAEFIKAGILSGMQLQNSTGTHKLEMSESTGGVGTYGTFRLYNNNYATVPYFSVYDDTFGSIGLFVAGSPFLGASASGGVTVTPRGTWDFSQAAILGTAKFG